ncbi:MAG: hypothetical protein JST51_17715 [Armatimonadetes bacterium]|nr:hypothetical protein [Armatimonadota bacterium]
MRIYRALPLALVCLAGCGGPSLVGKWTMSGASAPPGAITIIEFTSDSFTQTVDMAQPIQVHAVGKGVYKIQGDKISMTVNDVEIDDSKFPEALKAAVKGTIDKQKGQTITGTLKIEGDTATITADKGTITLAKVK